MNIIDKIIEAEGGFVNDEYDSGGETKFGISKNAYPDIDIASLTLDDARSIYKKDYYDELNADEIKDEQLRLQVVDFGVNAGVYGSAKLLQRIVGAKEDGQIGKKTLLSLEMCDKDVNYEFIKGRIEYYCKIVERNNTQGRFIKGWTRRAFKMYK